MKTEILDLEAKIMDLIDERFERNRYDLREGWVTREEYTAVKVEMMILKTRIEEITRPSSNRKDKSL